MAHGVVCHFDLPHMAQKVADWTRREGRPRADEMANGAVCRFELPHVAENNRRVTRVDSSLWPQRTVPKLPSGTNGCQTLKTATLNTSYFCQKRPLCQPPPSPTPPPNSHFVRKVKLRLAYRLAFVIYTIVYMWIYIYILTYTCSAHKYIRSKLYVPTPTWANKWDTGVKFWKLSTGEWASRKFKTIELHNNWKLPKIPKWGGTYCFSMFLHKLQLGRKYHTPCSNPLHGTSCVNFNPSHRH